MASATNFANGSPYTLIIEISDDDPSGQINLLTGSETSDARINTITEEVWESIAHDELENPKSPTQETMSQNDSTSHDYVRLEEGNSIDNLITDVAIGCSVGCCCSCIAVGCALALS